MPTIPSLLSVGGQKVRDEELESINNETITAAETLHVSELYYFDEASIPAITTVEDHLNKLEIHINEFLRDIGKA